MLESFALRLLRETTSDQMLKNALTRALGETPTFEVGDKVFIHYDGAFNGFATVTRRNLTKDGACYAVRFDGLTSDIEGFSGDDMELNDRTAYDEWRKLRSVKSNE